jgi:cell division ATPase FtsA
VSKYYLNDYEIVKLEGHKGRKIGADILATFLPIEVVDSLNEVINNADMEVYSLTLEPIAAINVAIPENFRLLNLALVDIGAGTSDIAITKDGGIIAYGMIPSAGDEITETIVHEYLVDFNTAEKIKIDASGKNKTVTFNDIIGITHNISSEKINKKIDNVVSKLADSIGKKIISLNGGFATNAVFIVGGGGQVKGFRDKLAEKLKLSKDRIAIRGDEVLKNVHFQNDELQKGPEMVTPIGICYSGLENNKHDFIQVYLNDEPLRVFNKNNLTVMDVAALKGFDPKKLIPRRGKDLIFTINGLENKIKGKTGDSAKILVNNKEVSLSTYVVMNDYISIIPAKNGTDAELTTNKLINELDNINITINDEKYEVKPLLLVNDKEISLNYDIKNNDTITTINPNLKYVLNKYNISYSNQNIQVNDTFESLEYTVNDYDNIMTYKNNATEANIVEEKVENIVMSSNDNKVSINILVNNKSIKLDHKKEYIFVDIFDYIDFDLSESHGTVICKINDKTASYTEKIHNGDVLEVYWSNLK